MDHIWRLRLLGALWRGLDAIHGLQTELSKLVLIIEAPAEQFELLANGVVEWFSPRTLNLHVSLRKCIILHSLSIIAFVCSREFFEILGGMIIY